jgi:hypothetical protein
VIGIFKSALMSSSLNDLLLNDRGFAFDPTGGETFQLSPTGLRIVRLLQQDTEEEVIIARMLEEYEVDEHTARRDLRSFLSSIESLGWK